MNILLIGCGNIGRALLNVWAESNAFDKIIAVQPSMSTAADFEQYDSVTFVDGIRNIPKDCAPDVTVLAIKPQIANDVIPNLTPQVQKSLLISTLAGTSLNKLAKLTRDDCKIIRIMPTVAIKTRQSVNLAFANKNVRDNDIKIMEKLVEPSGKIVWVSEENHIDILTPISGSGLAYFFLLTEILVEESVRLGIDENIARRIIRGVLVGASSLASDAADFAALRQSVTSKGGVTEAALKIMSPGMRELIQKSLEAALVRIKDRRCRAAGYS
jgi:pyrroline-5-carboxylate reductase